jgi:putative PIN family toxin of toxin-antitoxin system
MIRAVLDTNVLASAFLRHGSPPDQALRAAVAGLYRLIISDHILEELSRTLVQPYFRARLSAEQLAANLEVIRLLSEHVSPTTSVRGVAPHPEDDLVLAAALNARADYLVTGDRAFLRVRQHQGTRLVTPQAFLVALAVQP